MRRDCEAGLPTPSGLKARSYRGEAVGGEAVPLAFSHYPFAELSVQMGRKGNTRCPLARRELTSSGGVWELSSHHHQEAVAFDNVTSQWWLSA